MNRIRIVTNRICFWSFAILATAATGCLSEGSVDDPTPYVGEFASDKTTDNDKKAAPPLVDPLATDGKTKMKNDNDESHATTDPPYALQMSAEDIEIVVKPIIDAGAGKRVELNISVKNISKNAVEFNTTSENPPFSIVVWDKDGRIVSRPLAVRPKINRADKKPTEVNQTLSLGPGESKNWRVVIADPGVENDLVGELASGAFEVQATLPLIKGVADVELLRSAKSTLVVK